MGPKPIDAAPARVGLPPRTDPPPGPAAGIPVAIPDQPAGGSAPIPEHTRRTVTQQLRRVVSAAVEVERRHHGRSGPHIAYPIMGLRVLIQTLRQWARDHCPQQASSLAFDTTLALVPLIATALAALEISGAFEAQSSLVKFLSTQVIPISRQEIAGYLLTWAGKMSFRAAGAAGLLATLGISYMLFASVEGIFNAIWRTERRRSLAQKALVFYPLITVIPMAMGVSLYHAAHVGLTTGVAGALGSLAAVWAALFFANKLLPTTHVSNRAAAIGALVSALAFEAAKILFQLYVTKVAFQKYSGVYGPLGLVPIVLLWIYYAWLVILFGAEVSHSVQNLRHLERLDTREAQPLDRELFDKVNAMVAARLLVAVVAEFQQGGRGLTRSALASRFDVSELVVDRIFRRLKEHGLVLEVEGDARGYLPARPPARITLAEVFDAFRGTDIVSSTPTSDRTRLDLALDDLAARQRDRAAAISFEDLARSP